MKAKGFTLLEVLITISLLVILSTLGLTSYSYLIRKNEQQVVVDELKTAVHYAKMQSLILGHPVVLTSLDDSFNWSNGIKLSILNKKLNKMELLHQWQWHHPRWNLSWKGVYSTEKIVFSNNPVQAVSNGRFILVNRETNQQMSLILNRLGRIRVDVENSL